mmetsp:Transcript_26986/g.78563  ORF Transcript_26986/g.78563 Transcript_26986/m.78563 type:complete len:226 (+) Transcript_26986:1133-1810(+)
MLILGQVRQLLRSPRHGDTGEARRERGLADHGEGKLQAEPGHLEVAIVDLEVCQPALAEAHLELEGLEGCGARFFWVQELVAEEWLERLGLGQRTAHEPRLGGNGLERRNVHLGRVVLALLLDPLLPLGPELGVLGRGDLEVRKVAEARHGGRQWRRRVVPGPGRPLVLPLAGRGAEPGATDLPSVERITVQLPHLFALPSRLPEEILEPRRQRGQATCRRLPRG